MQLKQTADFNIRKQRVIHEPTGRRGQLINICNTKLVDFIFTLISPNSSSNSGRHTIIRNAMVLVIKLEQYIFREYPRLKN